MKKLVPAPCLLFACPVHAVAYDVAINCGRVMNPETRLDGVCNVGTKDGRTAIIKAAW